MKLTCLSKGGGFHFPPCYILDLCGFRFLLECPVDLSALTVFSPIPNNVVARQILNNLDEAGEDSPNSKRMKTEVEGRVPGEGDLIKAVPWYKTVKNLHLWDFSLIDVVLVSSPMGMLGLPFLARSSKFSGKIYATEATSRIGQIMMDDLVSMHVEYIQFYGPDEEGSSPEWLKWEELETLPYALKKIIMGEGGEDLGAWLPLYSAEDVNDCMKKVQTVKYSEESCYNGIFILKAFSSGLEIGTSNWTICSPRGNVTYLSSSIFESPHAMELDYCSLQGNDVILFSDFSSLHSMVDSCENKNERKHHKELEDELPHVYDVSDDSGKYNVKEEMGNCLVVTSKSNEEVGKIDFICSCIVDSVKGGGSVLIPVGRLGVILQLLEQLSRFIDSSHLKVPIYMISAAAQETLAYTNSLPEWLCKERQQKLYSGEALFGHVELITGKKLHIFPALHSSNLLMTWEEPCIVFSPHWNLRLGPIVHLLRRWHVDRNSLLILEQGVDADMALLPFKPVALKVLQCAFLSGILKSQVQPLLEVLQPKFVLFPEDLRAQFPRAEMTSSPFLFYSENETLRVPPRLRDDSEAYLSAELAFQLQPRRMPQENRAIARLKGQLVLQKGKYMLVPTNESFGIPQKKLHWGSVDPKLLLLALQGKGIHGSVKRYETDSDGDHYCISVDGREAMIEACATQTIICAADETLTTQIYEAFCSVAEGI